MLFVVFTIGWKLFGPCKVTCRLQPLNPPPFPFTSPSLQGRKRRSKKEKFSSRLSCLKDFYVNKTLLSGIRDRIISKSVCVCGATNVLADDLLPNKTLRDTINRILESNNSSAENAGSTSQVQGLSSIEVSLCCSL